MGNRRYRIVFKAKTGEEDLQRFREMARATVALGSDPMDEAGLKGIDVFSSKVLDTQFDYEIRNVQGKVSKPNPSRLRMFSVIVGFCTPPRVLPTRIRRGFLLIGRA